MDTPSQFVDLASERVKAGLHPETGDPFETGPKAEAHALAVWPQNFPDVPAHAEAKRRRQMCVDYFAAKKKPPTK